jgi:RNA polymerase sigma-70 factor, ECF subfamily
VNEELRTSEQEPLSPGLFTAIIAKARLRDEDALALLYRRALPVVYRYAVARLGGTNQVDDVVADVFLEMVERIGELRADHEAGFYAWIIRIAQGKVARNIHMLVRGKTHHVSFSSEIEGEAIELPTTDRLSDPAVVQELRETLGELGAALQALTSDQQTVVIGRYLAGWSIEALAGALHKQPGAIRALQFRALETLAEHLGLTREKRRDGRKRGQP